MLAAVWIGYDMSVVRKTNTGKYIWESPEAKRQAIAKELNLQGYLFAYIGVEDLDAKYYLSLSSTTYTRHLVDIFVSQSQVQKYVKDWNKYDRIYEAFEILHRDSWEVQAAERILNSGLQGHRMPMPGYEI